jgi:hypothetical protein
VPYLNLGMHAARRFLDTARPQAVVTHHHLSPQVMKAAKAAGCATVLIQHNDHKGQMHFLDSSPDLVVYNTQWVRESVESSWPRAQRLKAMVVRPPADAPATRPRMNGKAVTLVNLSLNKGVITWRESARALPRIPFLGVSGAHGTQVYAERPANTELIAPTPDMRRDVWARTRLLMVPSVYESYGLVAAEALAYGVPVLAHPTPGLREALGDAGVFCDRADVPAWTDAISRLHPAGKARTAVSAAVRERGAVLAERSAVELAGWTRAVTALAASSGVR